MCDFSRHFLFKVPGYLLLSKVHLTTEEDRMLKQKNVGIEKKRGGGLFEINQNSRIKTIYLR